MSKAAAAREADRTISTSDLMIHTLQFAFVARWTKCHWYCFSRNLTQSCDRSRTATGRPITCNMLQLCNRSAFYYFVENRGPQTRRTIEVRTCLIGARAIATHEVQRTTINYRNSFPFPDCLTRTAVRGQTSTKGRAPT
jgi:hypothetical protein